jgi:uncharacterized protein (DUF885 family)
MDMKMKNSILLFLALTLIACGSKDMVQNDKALLDSLSQQYWNRELRTGHSIKITGGKSPLPDKLYFGNKQDYQEDSVYFSKLLQTLQQIDVNKLPMNARVDYDLLQWVAEMRLEGTHHYENIFPLVTPYANHLNTNDLVFKQASFDSETDLKHYLELLNQYSEVQKHELAKFRRMESRGIRLPKPEIKLTLDFIKTLQVKPTAHPYYPQAIRLQKIDKTSRESFQGKASQIIEQKILPNHDSLFNYLGGDYFKNASETVGLGQYPGGKDYYRYLVKWHTTTDLTPEEIHELGKKQVAQISSALDSIRLSTQFKGDMKAFYTFLQKDKRFLASTPDEVGERIKKPLVRMDTVIHRLISARPKAGYDVRRLARTLEPAMTFGNYLPPAGDEPLGVYYYNGSKLDQRPLTGVASLAFHEIIPGHHWQVSLQSENKSLSEFRKNMVLTAYSEGWGDYASYLGIELGLFDDPYDYCGRLLMDMFISVRLVVDVGMNHFGWSREQAMEYMRTYLIESEEQINTESIRYSCDIQGQALGYKIGSLKLIELRKKYQIALGKNFSVIKFHDAVLRNGNLPLAVLEKSLDREFGVQ